MSTILKALRRLEQEKSTQSDRPLSEAVANTPAPPAATRSLSPWLVAAGSLALAFSVTVGVFWFLSAGDVEPPPERVASADVPAAPRPVADPPEVLAARRKAAERAQAARLKRQAESAAADLPPEALSSEVEVVERKPQPPDRAIERLEPREVLEMARNEPPRPGLAAFRPDMTGIVNSPVTPSDERDSVPEPARRPAERVAETAAARAATEPVPATARESEPPEAVAPGDASPSAVVESETDTKSKRTAAPEVVAAVVPTPKKSSPATPPRPSAKPAPPAPVAEAPAPEPEPVAVERKPALPPVPSTPDPEIFVASTMWHPIADRRVAVIELGGDGKTIEVREGDMIGPLVVGKIEPSGVYFTNNGSELRRRVGAR